MMLGFKSSLLCNMKVFANSIFRPRAILALGLAAMAIGVSQPAVATEDVKQLTPEQIAAEIRANTQYLLQHVTNKTKSIIENHDDFAPFGAALMPNGNVRYVWAVPPGESLIGVNGQLVLNSVRKALTMQAQQGRILGSAVVYDYKPSPDSEIEQVNIELEYLGGYAEVVATEYTLSSNGVTFHEGAAKKFSPMVFAGNGSDSPQ
ncbi:hypothetical protein [Marinobacter alexandrii]|jgi:hypothetical protein|uniref:hypothetical protein n=1 Tax=Marinobacter alexandrii TaxID=2570351 RepID=UPI002ABE10F2|nr:hypothetical protein [Marinobacter alexandrii]